MAIPTPISQRWLLRNFESGNIYPETHFYAFAMFSQYSVNATSAYLLGLSRVGLLGKIYNWNWAAFLGGCFEPKSLCMGFKLVGRPGLIQFGPVGLNPTTLRGIL